MNDKLKYEWRQMERAGGTMKERHILNVGAVIAGSIAVQVMGDHTNHRVTSFLGAASEYGTHEYRDFVKMSEAKEWLLENTAKTLATMVGLPSPFKMVPFDAKG